MKKGYYSEQARNNMVCLYEDSEYFERKEVFLELIKSFKENNVKWALGCSMNLFCRGIIDDFHDLDLIVSIESIDVVKRIMQQLGADLTGTGGNGFCESDIYMHYQLGRVDIDIISGFRVVTFGTSYYYPYNENEIDMVKTMGIEIPMVSLEAMYILYYMMEGWQPKRKFKRQLIEQAFEQEKPRHVEVFQNALNNQSLPAQIKWAVKSLLSEGTVSSK